MGLPPSSHGGDWGEVVKVLLDQMLVVEPHVSMQRLAQFLGTAEVVCAQHLFEAAIEALDHAVGLRAPDRAQAQRLAAAALRTSPSALGASFRRLSARMDKPKAVTAAAHKLARLIYSMLTKGEEYTDQGQAYYEERCQQRLPHNLNRQAQQLGMTLVATAPAAQAA